MKYIITEGQLKNFLKKKFKVDLTGKIQMITTYSELPYDFDIITNPRSINYHLNLYGPMYLFSIYRKIYLYQNQGRHGIMLYDSNDKEYTEREFLDMLGIPPIGISIDDIIDEYVTEDINESSSRYDEYQIRWRKFEMFMKRRDDEIKNLISQHSHAYSYDPERYDDYVIVNAVVDMVAEDFVIENDLNDEDSYEYDWVHEYLKDNYSNYIKKQIGI